MIFKSESIACKHSTAWELCPVKEEITFNIPEHRIKCDKFVLIKAFLPFHDFVLPKMN